MRYSMFFPGCSATLVGKTPTNTVQDVGFRALIESLGRVYNLRGFVFNYPDGSVTIYCGGDNKVISNFFEDIRTKRNERGIVFKIVDKIELPPDCRLPVEFLKLDTDDKIDNSRKLDKGIEILKDIKGDTSAIQGDTSALPGIKGDTSILPEIKVGIDNMNMKFDSFIHGQEGHNLRLEKILEKLAER